MNSIYLILIILLNAVPLYGVFFHSWQSFDLIFLYWLENLIIGLFTIIRFAIRPYSHAIELIFPLLLAPFFAFHYGMFCFIHGSFVVSLFGNDLLNGINNQEIPAVILPIIEMRHLFWPVIALLTYQLIDYIRDSLRVGLGSDNVITLMTAPYRRIIVLHLTIIISGFALTALNEPLAGLIILIILKMAFDIHFYLKDEKKTTQIKEPQKDIVLDEKMKAKIDQMIDNPTVTINGNKIHFETYEEFQNSKYYGMMKTMVRLIAGGKQWNAVETYVQQRLAEKNTVIRRTLNE